jgi:serine/threonine-protein kinase
MTDYDFTGRTLNQRYVLKRQIGAGSFATVYLADDLRMYKRKVAIKVLNPERRLNPGNEERFIQEVKVAAKLDGPYRDRVVRIIDQGRCDVAQPPLLYLVMEYVEGVTLQALLRPGGPTQPRRPLPWTQAVSIIRELLKALATLHGCGVVHRDIKPGNCILEQRPDGDYLKLLDLGIVKVMPGFEMTGGDHPRTHPEFVLGTPRYMAPEQFGGPCSDPRVDLYAAGIMLYEFLTGDVPSRWFEQKGAAHPYEPLPPSQIYPLGAIPPTLDAIVLRAIAFEPAKRFPTAVAFAEALSAVLLATSSVRDEPPLREALVTSTQVATPRPASPAVVSDEPGERLGSMLRWWTIAATTLTAMVFVVAFASLLRQAESRPALELESDEAPALAELPRRRPPPAPVVAAVAAEPSAAVSAEPAPVPAEVPAEPTPVPIEPPPPAAEPKRPLPADPALPRPKKPRVPQSGDTDDPGELMPVRPTTIAAIKSLAERELARSCGDPSARRPLTVVVGIDAATGKLRRVELRGEKISETLRACVAGRASKAFQFAGLRERGSEYKFDIKL